MPANLLNQSSVSWYRWLVLTLLLVLILTAALGTFGLGTPLGMSTKAVAWQSLHQTGTVTIHSTEQVTDLAGPGGSATRDLWPLLLAVAVLAFLAESGVLWWARRSRP